MKDGRIVSSFAVSDVLKSIPAIGIDYVFVREDLLQEAKNWLEDNREEIIKPRKEEE